MGAPKSPDYRDSPEYRKSLHLQQEEKQQHQEERQWKSLKMVTHMLPLNHPHIHTPPRPLPPMKSQPPPHTRKQLHTRAPPPTKLQRRHMKPQQKPQQKLRMTSHQVTLSHRMATLELKLAMVEMVEMLLPLQWVVRVVAGMLLLPLMRSTSLRPLTTQALSTSKSRFEKIVGNGIKEIDHLKLK